MVTCKLVYIDSAPRLDLIYANIVYRSLYSTAWPQVDPRVKAVAPIAGGPLDNKLMANIVCKYSVGVGYDVINAIRRPSSYYWRIG